MMKAFQLERFKRILSTECDHEFAHIDEMKNWGYCPKCKIYFPHSEMLTYTGEELQCYSQEHSIVRSFAKYLRKLRREDPYLPDYMPLQHAFIRFTEAYKKCRFYRNGKRVGKSRNLFGSAYTTYRLAKLISETDQTYLRWMEKVKPLLPPLKQIPGLNDHWTLLNVNLSSDWKATREEYQSLSHLLRSKLK